MELWVRCPKARLVKKPHKRSRWFCPCHGDWDDTLLRVPDGAVERMLDAWNTKLQTPMGARKRAEKRVLCERLLAAAVGGET